MFDENGELKPGFKKEPRYRSAFGHDNTNMYVEDREGTIDRPQQEYCFDPDTGERRRDQESPNQYPEKSWDHFWNDTGGIVENLDKLSPGDLAAELSNQAQDSVNEMLGAEPDPKYDSNYNNRMAGKEQERLAEEAAARDLEYRKEMERRMGHSPEPDPVDQKDAPTDPTPVPPPSGPGSPND